MYKVLKFSCIFLFFVLTISVAKIAFCGIELNNKSLKIYLGNEITINPKSEIKIKSADLDSISDDPILIHVETQNEYNERIKKSISYYEYKNKH